MPPKRAAAASAKSSGLTNGTATKKTSTKSKATSATKAKSKPKTKAAKTPAKPAAKTSAASKPTKKRKADDVDDGEDAGATGAANKRQKSSRSVSASVEATKQTITATKAKAVAAKKPKAVKKVDVINHAPLQRLNVYVFGDGSSGGELGLGSGKGQSEVRRPRLNPHLAADTVGVVQVACGGMHTACLTHDNKILTWGVNDQGALGRDTNWDGGLRDITEDGGSDDSDSEGDGELNPHESTPGAVDFSDLGDTPNFTQVACTDSATFALTEAGDVYGWGTFRSNEGIFGFSRKSLIQSRPSQVEGLKKIKQLATGANHVLARDTTGNVWAWGSGQQNQLGRRILERHQVSSLTPSKFGLKKGAELVGAGAYHSFAVLKSGDVYSWGLNSFGETGITHDEDEEASDVHHPALVESFRDFGKVTQIEGGAHHSIAVTDKGECLVWGRVDGFQLGLKLDTLPEKDLIKDSHGQSRILSRPTPVPGIDAVHAAAGTDHSVAVARDGKAYSWGFSFNCQTGLGTEEDVEVATMIDNTAVRGKKLVWAGAGGQFSVLAGEDTPMVNGVNGHT